MKRWKSCTLWKIGGGSWRWRQRPILSPSQPNWGNPVPASLMASIRSSGTAGSFQKLGQHDKVIALYQQCWSIAEDVGKRACLGQTCGKFSLSYVALGQYEKAIELRTECLSAASGNYSVKNLSFKIRLYVLITPKRHNHSLMLFPNWSLSRHKYTI